MCFSWLLQCLSLGKNGVKMIMQEEFERSLLENLKVLSLCLGTDGFEYEILEQVPNIEKLVVCDGSLKEMLCCESPNNVDYSELLLQLKELYLESLPELVAWRLPFSNLTCLKVESCDSLPYLFTSSTAKSLTQLQRMEIKECESIEEIVSKEESDEDEIIFPQLTCLKVNNCPSLSYLFTSSTARSLGQLQRMEIKKCKSIEEIVSKEESDEDQIMFPRLRSLNLENLKKLTRFYRGSLSFPLLEELSITVCNEMVSLCAGTLKAAKLLQVTIDEEEDILLETDLNSTLMKEFQLKKVRVVLLKI